MSRPKGSLNKTSIAAKRLVAACFDDIGGEKAFAAWAKENQRDFYKLWGRLIPQSVSGEDGGPVQIVIRHT